MGHHAGSVTIREFDYNGRPGIDRRPTRVPLCLREGGETFEDAVVIGSLPYSDTSATCRAEFRLQLVLIYVTDCYALQYDLTTVFPCVDAVLARDVPRGAPVWIWVGPSEFHGIPCDSEYLLTLHGIYAGPGCEPTPVDVRSWGSIESLYKDT